MLARKNAQSTQKLPTEQIKDMLPVLQEIAPSWRILQDTLDQQWLAIYSPSIETFRRKLQGLITEATNQAELVTELTEKYVTISEEAMRHAGTIENHFSEAISKHIQV